MLQDVFTQIYQEQAWGVPVSSAFSRLEFTQPLRDHLGILLERFSIKSMLDAPCGDLTWMPHVKFPNDFTYIGGDIVLDLVGQNSLRHFDVTKDSFPAVDLWFCRDCLSILCYGDIAQVLTNLARSDIKYVMFSSEFNLLNQNKKSGTYSGLNLRAEPFNFPSPIYQVLDWIYERDRPGLLPRAMYLWEKSELNSYLAPAIVALEKIQLEGK